MEYRFVGSADLKVSALGLGASGFGTRSDVRESHRLLDRAMDAGITLIDTANVYGRGASETVIGEWLRRHRSSMVVATKAGLPVGPTPADRGASRRHLERELEASLKRLGTDYIDLYYLHTFDPATPLEETLDTLDGFVRQGKVRHIGASNYRAWELMKALAVSQRLHLQAYVANQISYSLADRTCEREMMPLLRDQGLGLIAYFPLGSGILTGKYRRGEPPEGSRGARLPGAKHFCDAEMLTLADAVREAADMLRAKPSQVALAWLLEQRELSSAIAGARTLDQLAENLGALSVSLTEEVRGLLQSASQSFVSREPLGEYRLD